MWSGFVLGFMHVAILCRQLKDRTPSQQLKCLGQRMSSSSAVCKLCGAWLYVAKSGRSFDKMWSVLSRIHSEPIGALAAPNLLICLMSLMLRTQARASYVICLTRLWIGPPRWKHAFLCSHGTGWAVHASFAPDSRWILCSSVKSVKSV